ncbi:NAD(P)H-binding protein [Microbacterium sp.]|uniref:NAD(P)H-binding protein n=1 Tax=Microbacterium sp. TaxID=51671 RepID=UPI003F96770E
MGDLVVVAGATGYAGRHLVAALAAQGHRVRVLVRSQERAERPGAYDAPSLRGLVAEWRNVDFSEPETLHDVCEGADRVVSALGVTRQKATPWDIDFLGNLRILEDGERHGVRSFLYVNVLNVEKRHVDAHALEARVHRGSPP